jgi:hypothetical protein
MVSARMPSDGTGFFVKQILGRFRSEGYSKFFTHKCLRYFLEYASKNINIGGEDFKDILIQSFDKIAQDSPAIVQD